MNILLTGSTGFVGRYLLDRFVERGHTVIGVGRNADALAGLGNKYGDNIALIRADLSRGLDCDSPIDIVIHAAAQSPYNCHRISQYIDNNITATLNIAQFARKIQAKRIVYLSSISVYGRVDVPMADENTDIVNPDAYGLTKHFGERILAESAQATPVVALRLPGILGKGDHTSWLSTVLKKALSNEDIRIYNPEAPFNNAVCLGELFGLIEAIIRKDVKGFEVVTLGASEPMSIKDTVQLVIDEAESASRVKCKESTRNSFLISNEKAKRLFDYNPSPIKRMLQFYISSQLDQQKDTNE